MTDKDKSVVNFSIDDLPSPEQSSKKHDEDYKHKFCDFLKTTEEKSKTEKFSYHNKAVQKAGRRLRKKKGDLKSATSIIQTFRAAHEEPLNTIAYLVGRCCRELKISVKPVKRLKRLDTIIDKLQRKSLDGKTSNGTCVTNMNDIGGCRAIFPDIDSLNKVKDKLKAAIKNEERVKIKDIDDYITAPKLNDCGYRSLHIIYLYKHSSRKNFNIEVQLRTRLQHLWATTVEIIDMLEGINIKTHSHSPDSEKSEQQIKWEELLAIMSKYIADAEGIVPLSAKDKVVFSDKLKRLNEGLNAVSRLKSFKIMSEKVESLGDNGAEHILLIVDEQKQHLLISQKFENRAQAISVYNEAENITRSADGINTLLVSTKDMGQLAEAYPNYLGDCAAFIEILEQAMEN